VARGQALHLDADAAEAAARGEADGRLERVGGGARAARLELGAIDDEDVDRAVVRRRLLACAGDDDRPQLDRRLGARRGRVGQVDGERGGERGGDGTITIITSKIIWSRIG